VAGSAAGISDSATAVRPDLTVRTRTLDDYIRSRSPGLDAMRLVLAFLVLVSHTWPLGGFGSEPLSPLTPRYLTLGGFAVAGFFALSGLLVGRSALTRSSRAYARARIVRIVPAYWTALVVGGFVVAGLGWIHAHRTLAGFMTVEPGGPVGHVLRGALFPTEFSYGVNGVFITDTPFGRLNGTSFVNGSLWTLPNEIRCYLVIGVVAVAARRFGSKRAVGAAWLATGALAVAFWVSEPPVTFVIGPYADQRLIMFVFIFLSGALAGLWADRIALFGPVPLIALAIGLIAGHTSLFLSEHVAGAMLVFILPPIAAVLEPAGRLLHGVDLSYGLYLYSWPVQQLVAMYRLADRPLPFIAISTAGALGLAAASWFVIERPAMRRFRRP
jgi:peptidoglycan/LPS O-acetylase OafA/YrhL